MRFVKRRRAAVALLIPPLSWIGIVMIYPMAYSLKLSLSGWVFAEGPKSNVFVGMANFLAAMRDPAFLLALRNTLWYVLFSVILTLLIGLLTALLFNQEGHYVKALRSLTMIPLMLSPIVAGLIWQYIFMERFGILNYLLRWVGITTTPRWLYDPLTAKIAVIIVQVWQTTPLSALIILGGLTGIPGEINEAARVEGAAGLQLLWRITLPLLVPAILVSLLLQTIGSYRIFDQIWMLTGGGPGGATESASTFIVRLGISYTKIGQATAYGFLILLIAVPFVTLYVWSLLRKD